MCPKQDIIPPTPELLSLRDQFAIMLIPTAQKTVEGMDHEELFHFAGIDNSLDSFTPHHQRLAIFKVAYHLAGEMIEARGK